MCPYEPHHLHTFGEDTVGTFGKRSAEESAPGEHLQEKGQCFFLVGKSGGEMQEFAADIRYEPHRGTFVAVKHILFDTREAVREVIRMVARGGVKMCEEYFKQDIGGDSLVVADKLLRLKYFFQMMERNDNIVTYSHDEIAADDKIYFLVFRFAIFPFVNREVEHKERHVFVLRDERCWGGENKFSFYTLVNRKFLCNLLNFVNIRPFEVYPYAAGIVVPK